MSRNRLFSSGPEMTARQNAARKLMEWGVAESVSYEAKGGIIDLLGYAHGDEMFDRFSEDDCRKLKLICGPHGWAIYKMLIVRQS